MAAADFRVVIPARHASTRLPGKPLLLLAGRPMIEHVWQRAQESGAREVIVATDDERIRDAVLAFGGDVEMTSPDHASGTDRLAEVAARRSFPDDAIVVNLQGDEPLMPSALVADMARALSAHEDAGIATLATPIHDAADIWNPNVVKVVCDDQHFALYFSRAPIPWLRSEYQHGLDAPPLPTGIPVLRHLGLYAYRVQTLRTLAASPPALLEQAESLEQLRALALGMRIHVSVVANAPPPGVDTADDLARAETAMRNRPTLLAPR